MFNQVLNHSNSSRRLKSVLLEHFLRDFNPAHHMREILEYFPVFDRLPNKRELNYMESFIEQAFGIEKVGKYAMETARVYYAYKQIEFIRCRLQKMKVIVETSPIYTDLIFGKPSWVTMKMIIRRLELLSKIKANEEFDSFYNTLKDMKKDVSTMRVHKEYLGVKLINAHLFLQSDKEKKNSSTFINKLKKEFLSENMY